MRYFWALMAYVAAIVVAVASCSGAGTTRLPTGSGNGGASAGSGQMTGSGGTSTSTGTANGGGGSMGAFISVGVGTGGSGPCPAFKTCMQQGYTCGMQSDGCGSTQDCGTCMANQICTGGTCTTACTPKTCTGQGFTCGMQSDGCGNTISCGTCPMGQVCGMGGICGNSCNPQNFAQLGYTCGNQGDGCGNTINCGTCPAGQACGGGGKTGQCGGNVCVPKTCAQQNFTCGQQTDGCSTVIDCGTCGSGTFCTSTSTGAFCSSSTTCTGFCMQQQACPGGGTTSISGSVFAPNGVDVLPGVLVYVPNGSTTAPYGLQPFQDGVATPHCSCGSDVTGNPLVSAVTNFDGTFTITNMPVGTNIPLVIQKGRWRRLYTISNVPACTNTAIPASGAQQLRFPQKEAEFSASDNIPLMAFSTGSVDALECVLRKIGIQDGQFSDPSGKGRVRFYMGSGSAGASYSASTPSDTQLFGSQATVNGYDIVYFACQGAEYPKTAQQQSVMVNYANQGGRIFATHYSYVWMDNANHNATWSPTAQWTQAEGGFANDPGAGLLNVPPNVPPAGLINPSNPSMTDPRVKQLADWLQFIGASTTYGQMSVNTLRQDFSAVNTPSTLWLWVNDQAGPFGFPPGLGNVPLHYTFDTPWNVAPANQCGRVLYSDFHVEDAATSGYTFPAECMDPTMTPQEKMLEFMIFDLGSCVTPPVCIPKMCPSGVTCGPASDGCGNIIQCGMCPSGQACIAGHCGNTCLPQTCNSLGFTCGNQGDGCGNVLMCGSCPSGQACNHGTCGGMTCTPMTQCPTNGCGSVSDGCGNVLNCGNCPSGQTCGGGGVANTCGAPTCTPKTCMQLGYNCGKANDGCGNVIDCGACPTGEVCGGGIPPVANVCGSNGGGT